MLRAVQASAPGSLMLMGEHAVLRGHPAIVCAIHKRMKVTLRPLDGKAVRLHSALGSMETTLEELAPDESFRFVLGAIRAVRDGGPGGAGGGLEGGFELDIRSEMSHQMGLGSSAAVTVAVLAALAGAKGERLDPCGLLETGVKVIRKVQGGVGSGADVAASVYGGCLRYFANPCEALKLSAVPEITVLYSGSKMPTPDVIALVGEKRKLHEEVYEGLDALIGKTVRQAFEAAAAEDWESMGALMNINQGLMDALGVNNAVLSRLVYELRGDPKIHGSKISGSGLGDCVVGLGKAMRRDWGVPMVAVGVDAEGAVVREMAE